MKAAERAERDQKILRLWIAGASYPRIAQSVHISARQAERIVRAALAEGASRRALLSEEALAVHQERLAVHLERHEQLLNAHLEPALAGDHRSAEICRRLLDQNARLLDQNARLHGLYGDASPALPAPTTPLTSEDDGREDEEPGDELSKLRARRSSGT